MLISSFLSPPSLDIRKVPVRLVSTTAFQAFSFILSAVCGNWPPPLLIKKSIWPKLSTAEAIVDLRRRKNIERDPFVLQLMAIWFMW